MLFLFLLMLLFLLLLPGCYKATSLKLICLHQVGLEISVCHPDNNLLAAFLTAPASALRVRLSVPSVLGRSDLVETGLSPGPAVLFCWLWVRLGKMGSGSILGKLGEDVLASSQLAASTRGRRLASLLSICALAKEGFTRPGRGKHLLEFPLPEKCPGQIEKESPVRAGGGGSVACCIVLGGGHVWGAPVVEARGNPI